MPAIFEFKVQLSVSFDISRETKDNNWAWAPALFFRSSYSHGEFTQSENLFAHIADNKIFLITAVLNLFFLLNKDIYIWEYYLLLHGVIMFFQLPHIRD